MYIYNVHEAKTNLSKLLKLVEEGKEVTIAKAGVPVAEIVKPKKKLKPRKRGALAGKIFVPDDFNDEDEEINKLFYEGDPLDV